MARGGADEKDGQGEREEGAMIIDLALPAPPSELSPNSRLQWWERNPIKRMYQDAVLVDVLNAKRAYEVEGAVFPLVEPVTMTVTFLLPDKRHRDWDNLIAAFKAGQDTIVRAGIISGDSISVIERVSYEWAYGAAGVLVRIEAGLPL